MPLRPQEMDVDSEDERDPEWLREKTITVRYRAPSSLPAAEYNHHRNSFPSNSVLPFIKGRQIYILVLLMFI